VRRGALRRGTSKISMRRVLCWLRHKKLLSGPDRRAHRRPGGSGDYERSLPAHTLLPNRYSRLF